MEKVFLRTATYLSVGLLGPGKCITPVLQKVVLHRFFTDLEQTAMNVSFSKLESECIAH